MKALKTEVGFGNHGSTSGPGTGSILSGHVEATRQSGAFPTRV